MRDFSFRYLSSVFWLSSIATVSQTQPSHRLFLIPTFSVHIVPPSEAFHTRSLREYFNESYVFQYAFVLYV